MAVHSISSIFLVRYLSNRKLIPAIRASAQGLFMTMVNGVGAWVGSILSGMAVDYFSVDGVKDWQTIWLVFAGYALFLAVIFFFGFKYNHDPEKIKHRAVAH